MSQEQEDIARMLSELQAAGIVYTTIELRIVEYLERQFERHKKLEPEQLAVLTKIHKEKAWRG